MTLCAVAEPMPAEAMIKPIAAAVNRTIENCTLQSYMLSPTQVVMRGKKKCNSKVIRSDEENAKAQFNVGMVY
jgi:hypothetical protein